MQVGVQQDRMLYGARNPNINHAVVLAGCLDGYRTRKKQAANPPRSRRRCSSRKALPSSSIRRSTTSSDAPQHRTDTAVVITFHAEDDEGPAAVSRFRPPIYASCR
jgi:hypothetical protein